jgi:hypothetical protein
MAAAVIRSVIFPFSELMGGKSPTYEHSYRASHNAGMVAQTLDRSNSGIAFVWRTEYAPYLCSSVAICGCIGLLRLKHDTGPCNI